MTFVDPSAAPRFPVGRAMRQPLPWYLPAALVVAQATGGLFAWRRWRPAAVRGAAAGSGAEEGTGGSADAPASPADF